MCLRRFWVQEVAGCTQKGGEETLGPFSTPGAILLLLPVNQGGSIGTVGLSGGGCGVSPYPHVPLFAPRSRPSRGPQTLGEVGSPFPSVTPILSTRASRITGQDPYTIPRRGAQGCQVWPEPGGGPGARLSRADPSPAAPSGGLGDGGGSCAGLRLWQSPPTDQRRRPRRAVLCPRRSRRGWPGPAASTTLQGPREERPPGLAPWSPSPLPPRGPERIRPTAKRNKRDPRN